MKTIASRLSLLLLPLLPLAAPAAAQEAPGAQGSFSDTLDVQAVDVEVVVTDRKGKPVPGLKIGDFRLLVDGKPVPPEYFAEVREGGVVAVPEPLQEGRPVPVPIPIQESDTVANSYLVFIDDYFTAPVMRNRALAGLAREVALMRPQDRMAVVSYDSRKLRVLAPWTPPGENLRKLLEELARRKAKLEASPYSIADLEPSADTLLVNYQNSVDRAAGRTGSLVGGQDTVAMRTRQTEETIGAAAATLRSFAGVSGRKMLLLLSGGWATFERDTGRKSADREERLMPLIDTCNLLGYTVYPIHLVESGPGELPSAGAGAVSASAPGGRTAGFTGMPEQRGLVVAAEETGGRFLVPGGDHRHLSRIAADARSYYWLGFTHSGETRRHAIQVEVVRPGAGKLQVRSRKGFVPLSRATRLDLDVERALLVKDAAGMKPLGVSAGRLEKVGVNRGELPVTVLIPAQELELIQRDGQYTAHLEMRVGALDDDGSLSDISVIPFEVTRDEPAAAGSHIRYQGRIKVRYAPQDLQFVVYDTVGGKSFAERVRIQP